MRRIMNLCLHRPMDRLDIEFAKPDEKITMRNHEKVAMRSVIRRSAPLASELKWNNRRIVMFNAKNSIFGKNKIIKLTLDHQL